MKQWCWKKFRCRQVKLSKSCALQARWQSGQGNSAPRSATTSRCSSCGRFCVSNRCPASFHGALKPSPSENTSLGSIPPPPMLQSRQHARHLRRFQPSADSTWNVEEPCLLAAEETSPSVLYGLYDVLSTAGAVYAELTSGSPGEKTLDVRIVSATANPFRCYGGVMVEPHDGIDQLDETDVAIVCDMY